MSTAANHRKRSHRSHRRAGYAAGMRKRNAAVGQAERGGFGLFRGLFHTRPRERNGRGPSGTPAPTRADLMKEAAE